MPRPPTPQAIRNLLAAASDRIAAQLPPGWRCTAVARTTDGGLVRFVAPDGRQADVTALVRKQLDPRGASSIDAITPTIVIANWLSPRTRTVLEQAGLSYADTTGNICVMVSEPGMAIRTEGASRDPSPRRRPTMNLRGPRAWAVERTLAEVLPPYGLTKLAETLTVDAGYLSRLLAGLADELLIERQPRQPIERVDWEAMIRQITRTYSLLDDNETTSWVAPAGPEQLLRDLSASKLRRWAVTGSFASSRLVSVAAPEIAVVYTDDPDRLAGAVRLLPTRTAANVVLALPYDPIVFERTWKRDGLTFASITQIAMDCLTGFGRMPQEGDALLTWMRRNAPKWQATSLTTTAEFPWPKSAQRTSTRGARPGQLAHRASGPSA